MKDLEHVRCIGWEHFLAYTLMIVPKHSVNVAVHIQSADLFVILFIDIALFYTTAKYRDQHSQRDLFIKQ